MKTSHTLPDQTTIEGVTESYRLLLDPETREGVRAQNSESLERIGYVAQPGVAFKVVTNSKRTLYVNLPPLPEDLNLTPEELSHIHASGTVPSQNANASTASTVGTAGTASTAFCFSVTLSSAWSVSTVGSMGTAGSAN